MQPAARQDTSSSSDWVPGWCGLATTDQACPFQCMIRRCPVASAPVATQDDIAWQDTAYGSSGVAGVLTMDHLPPFQTSPSAYRVPGPVSSPPMARHREAFTQYTPTSALLVPDGPALGLGSTDQAVPSQRSARVFFTELPQLPTATQSAVLTQDTLSRVATACPVCAGTTDQACPFQASISAWSPWGPAVPTATQNASLTQDTLSRLLSAPGPAGVG